MPDTNLIQKEFLEKLNEATLNAAPNERLLYHFLKDYEDKIFTPDDNPSSLHISFRRTDITGNTRVDAKIWQLLGECKIVWEVLDEMYPE
jgi:hypothetical protein